MSIMEQKAQEQLEGSISKYEEMCDEITTLKEREAKLVEALKFYSSYCDYDYWQPTGNRETATHTSKIHKDSGKKARELLKDLGVEI